MTEIAQTFNEAKRMAKEAAEREQAEWVAKLKTMRVSVDHDLVRRVALFVARQDIRYYLEGICIERAPQGGAYIVGTDGHTMGVAYDSGATMEGDFDRIIVRLAGAATSVRKRKGQSRPLRLLVDGLSVFVAPGLCSRHTDEEVFVQPGLPFIRGNFPDWHRVVPEFDKLNPGSAATVNASYLARINSAAAIAEKPFSRHRAVRFWSVDSNSVIAVQYERCSDFMALVMPMREDRSDDEARKAMSAFIKPKAKAEEPQGEPA